jgi:hypothetical protein
VKARKRFRKRLARKIRRHRHEAVAAVSVQRAFRGHMCRQACTDYVQTAIKMKKSTSAAVTIQRAWRGFECQQNYWQILGFTIRLQAIARGWIAKRRFVFFVDSMVRQQMMEQIITSATIIQRAVRLWMFHRERSHAATTINGFLRRKLHRKRFLCIVGTAVIIQRAFRRWMVLQDGHARDQAARTIQRFFLMVKAEVDREILRRQNRRKSSRKNRRKRIDPKKEMIENRLLEEAWDHLSVEEKYTTNGNQWKSSDKIQWAVEATLKSNPTNSTHSRVMVERGRCDGGKKGKETHRNAGTTMVTHHHPRHVKTTTVVPPPSPRLVSLSKHEIHTEFMLEEAWIDADIQERKERRQVTATTATTPTVTPHSKHASSYGKQPQQPSPSSSSRFLLPPMSTRSHQPNHYHVL